MTLAVCKCVPPRPKVKPGREDFCERCGFYIDPAWSSGDKTVREFFDRLASTLTIKGDDWDRFRLDCEERERAGRPRFGQSFHARDNAREGLEEACDLALYAMLDTLVAKRKGLGDEDIDVALTAAYHAFRGYGALLMLRDKRRGAP